MDFGLLPPEVNSGLMYTGPGSGPMLAAAAEWGAVAAQLESAASGYSSEVSGLTGRWFGPSSTRMAAAAAPYVAWLHISAVQAAQTAAQAHAAAAAYEAAFAMTVPPPVIAANRAQLLALIATNFLGQNTPAIAATEAHYMDMWVQDATAMYTYAADAEAASTLTPYDEPPQTTNETGRIDQTNAVARASGDTTGARARSAVQLASSESPSTVQDVPVGVEADAPAGSTIDLDTGTSIFVRGGSVTVTGANAQLMTVDSITVNVGSTVMPRVDVMWGSTVYSAWTPITADASTGPITLTPGIQGSVDVILYSGTATVPGSGYSLVGTNIANTASAVAGSTGATIFNAGGAGTGIVTITTITPVAPIATGASGASGGLGATTSAIGSSSAGLAGTAGIQPQLNVEGLLEWAQAVGPELAVPGG